MKFGYTIIYVANVEATALFYERAFGIKRRFVHESNQYAEMETGQTTLAFASNEMRILNELEIMGNDLANLRATGFEVAFVTENVEQSYTLAVSQGAISVAKPKLKPWGQQVAYVRDLNGVIIEICSEMK
jgi:lactoylglutathione lyase